MLLLKISPGFLVLPLAWSLLNIAPNGRVFSYPAHSPMILKRPIQ